MTSAGLRARASRRISSGVRVNRISAPTSFAVERIFDENSRSSTAIRIMVCSSYDGTPKRRRRRSTADRQEPGPRRCGRVALAGNSSLRSVPSRVRSGPRVPTDTSDGPATAWGNATTEAREAIARCGRLGSARVALGSAHGRRSEGPAPGDPDVAWWPVGGSRGGPWRPPASTDPERERSEPCAAGCGFAGVVLRHTPAGGRYVGVLIGQPCPPRRSAGHRAGASVPGRPDSARGASPRPAAPGRGSPGFACFVVNVVGQ